MALDLSQYQTARRSTRLFLRESKEKPDSASSTEPNEADKASLPKQKQGVSKRRRHSDGNNPQKRPKTSHPVPSSHSQPRTPSPERSLNESFSQQVEGAGLELVDNLTSSPLSSPPSSPTLEGQSLPDVPTNIKHGTLQDVENTVAVHLPSPPTEATQNVDDADVAMNDTITPSPEENVELVEFPLNERDAANESLYEQASPAGTLEESPAHTPSTPETYENLQLPTPPSSRPPRSRKPPKRFGDFLKPADVVGTMIEAPDESNNLESTDDGQNVAKKASVRNKRSVPLKATKQTNTPKATGSKRSLLAKSKITPLTKTASRRRQSTASTNTGSESEEIASTINVTPKAAKSPSGLAKKSPGRPSKTDRETTTKVSASLIVKLSLPSQPSLSLEKLDPAKLALSQKLTKRESLTLKPEPQGKPEVWAESRQALCETLPYFKKPQGGCYQNDGHVYGFLFDSVGHCREYMDENLIICRAGGSMESDGDGGMVQRKDQSLQEAQVQAVKNDINHHNPVIVICGDRNAKALCKMPHQYCVLDWYKPVFVWSEKTAGKGKKVWTTVKYRLERLNRHKPAWHAPHLDEPRISQEDRGTAGELLEKTCDQCNIKYPQVYLRDWMCLNAECAHFWKINGSEAPYGSEGLEYNPAFLVHESNYWKIDSKTDGPEPAPLRPPLPNIGNTIGDNLTYINTRGICCPQCGRCSSRRFFKGWYCENEGCSYELIPQHKPIIPAMLHTPWDIAPTLVRNRSGPNVKLNVEHRAGYKISTYSFGDEIKGRFIHAAPTKEIVQDDNGPDQMFAEMQTADMGLERRTFGVKKMSGAKDGANPDQDSASSANAAAAADEETVQQSEVLIDQDEQEPRKKPEFAEGDLMTAFSMNYGMPYKFVASGASQPFENAPDAVVTARDRLNWAAQEFLGKAENEHDSFNEELIFAYLEGQKIEYHDDGEEGLGPCIATLSLGGRAKMHLRMKQKHYVGCSKTGIFTEERPVPGGIEYEKRREKWDELQEIKEDSAKYNKRRKEIPKELGIYEKRTKKPDDLLTVTLSHGDIIIMDGYDIQKYLEHKVVPEGYLRFALTCRRVLENHLKPEELPNYSVVDSAQKYEGPKLQNE